MLYQSPLPPQYAQLEQEQLLARIAARKAELGRRLVILGHHYQSDDVIQFADFVGDSLKLSQQSAAQSAARYIVFCGVHFMAESADILSRGRAAVCLPHMMAGCGMAELAEEGDVSLAIDELSHASGQRVIPVTYVNSSAAIKAITARAGGACCTSSNVRNVFQWALEPVEKGGAGGAKILAIPDQHLGRNTAMAMGYAADQCAVYDPKLHRGGLSAEDVKRATFILWKGQCYVHQRFKPQHVQAVRAAHGGIRVIVHPECPREVVALADASGSTEQIIAAVAAGEAGSAFAIGTESNLVNRLAKRHTDKFIRTLGDTAALCIQMARIDLSHLLWTLDNLANGKVINQVRVPEAVAADARVALERMIAIKAVAAITPNTQA
jgi:quinolinate synthase